MTQALSLLLLFFIGCMAGWVMELFFRRFFAPGKRWVNPGFLTGPWLPIYGFGACTLYLLAKLEERIPIDNAVVRKVTLFLLMAICMTLIEYIAGLIFIKGLKTRLWDYSDEKFNLQGIICLRFSLIWTVLGALYYFLVHPFLADVLAWYRTNLQFSFIIGMASGIFIIDLVYSFNVVSKIRSFAKENDILVRYEELKTSIRKNAAEQKKKYKFLFALRPEVPIREHLAKYLEVIRAFEGFEAAEHLGKLGKKVKETRANKTKKRRKKGM